MPDVVVDRKPALPPRPAEPPVVEPPPEVVEIDTRELACVISLWQGYRTLRFFARIEEDGEEVAVAESEAFRTPPSETPLEAHDEAVAAFEALCRDLEAGGWQFASHGEEWFSDTWRLQLKDAAEPAPE